MRILIANRGEIARRVIRTASALGHDTVAVYADPDASAPHVSEATCSYRIGPAPLAESYLSVERLLAAANETESGAVHPGYGFLSENAPFAQAVLDAGLIWIGPSPQAITAMGSKIEARQLANSAGVPVIPGFSESQSDDDLRAAAVDIGFPVLIKASAGGGGKGIRIARSDDEFSKALSEARQEGERSFANADMIVERYIERPRHVEVQVVGDKHGTVIDLGTRECSVQRRYQKLFEEAPAPNLPDTTRRLLRQSAVALADSIGYDSTGTVEFIVDDDDPESYFFLEMNTRLQVEHPVTELVTGLDLVELQIRVAAGEPLGLAQDDVRLSGHAIEARINAENAADDFAPQIGTITHLDVPPGCRWDSGIEVGSEISPHYDPMIAKLIVLSGDRAGAIQELADALDRLLIGGVVTNSGFHRWLLDRPEVVAGRVTTRLLDEISVSDNSSAAAEVAASAWRTEAGRAIGSPWHDLGPAGFTPHQHRRRLFLRDFTGQVHEVDQTSTQEFPGASHVDVVNRRVVVNLSGQSHTFQVVPRSEHWAPRIGSGSGPANSVVAPFPGVVSEVLVESGGAVLGGDAVVVIEAMKMLHTLVSAGPGTVDEVRVSPGDTVMTHQVLVTFEQKEVD